MPIMCAILLLVICATKDREVSIFFSQFRTHEGLLDIFRLQITIKYEYSVSKHLLRARKENDLLVQPYTILNVHICRPWTLDPRP